MRNRIKKILNRTDLAQSGSHGGLVVTKNIQRPLLDFFCGSGINRMFQDKKGAKQYGVHYQEYTANRTTPNDRVTPIGSYAKDHGLKPGDILVFEKRERDGKTDYFLDFEKNPQSVYFVGKSREKAVLLNEENFQNVKKIHMRNGSMAGISPSAWEMRVKYGGKTGVLSLSRVNGQTYEMYFDKSHIERMNQYFELDASVKPFSLRRTNTWSMEIVLEEEEELDNDEEDAGLVFSMNHAGPYAADLAYDPVPEDKKPATMHGARTVPDRNPATAFRALQRAGHQCECDKSHRLFIRKGSMENYTEPHHLIPLKYDALFDHSLDVMANIVSLCSYCHDLIHYGEDAGQEICKLWEARKDELKRAGLGVMRDGREMDIGILLQFYHF